MTAICQPIPQSVAGEMLQLAARALCDRPGESAAQRESRTKQMVHFAMGFEPRDGVEYMLATLSYGHFCTVLDSIHDVFWGGTDDMKARTKTTIVALDRALISLVKEFRVQRKRPAAIVAERVPVEQEVVPDVVPEAEAAVPEPVAAETGAAEPVAAETGAAETGASGPAVVLSLKARDPDGVNTARRAERKFAGPQLDIAPPEEDEAVRLDRHLKEFEEAMAAAAESLKECDAMDAAKAKAATGD